ncbi:elongation factor Tu [Kibdelosporangium phytohabitans]|uniref:Elongation factor Tu n=1 Tax=Kibdelosporangium phytohabitans TaxID=860235 RepID=A0A0N9IDI1_9PSEU|nr:elongation factor Tu [Kibdelosporangium phytohabitans]
MALARNNAFTKPHDKQHINVGTIGHVGHGKSTLTVAITRVLHDKHPELNTAVTADDLDVTPEEFSRGITIPISHVEYETRTRHYTHIDCPGHAGYVRNMITGTSQMDVAILVVSALDGPMPQTREHLRIVKHLGVRDVVVALTKCDGTSDEYLVGLVEIEVRDLLSKNGFRGKEVPVIRLSASQALEGEPQWVERMRELLDALDAAAPNLRRDTQSPFLMPIEDTFLADGGTVVTGRIERGTIGLRHEVDLLGITGTRTNTVVDSIRVFAKPRDRAEAGDIVGLRLLGAELADVKRGMVLAEPRSVRPCTEVEVSAHVLDYLDDGRTHPFFDGYEAQFHFHTARVTGVVRLADGVEMASPGRDVVLTVSLLRPVVILEGMPFVMREGGLTVAVGSVRRLLS